MMKLVSFSAISSAMLTLGVAAPGQAALLNRAWVSGNGTDVATCGVPKTPCRTLQYVHDNVIAPTGEIDILDSAGYGPVVITKALSVVNNGVSIAAVQQTDSSLAAITINASISDAIYLRGLNINGVGTGRHGILLNSGKSLVVADCVVRNFAKIGISIVPTASDVVVSISNTIVSDNNYMNISIVPQNSGSVRATLAAVDASRSWGYGIWVDGRSSSALNTFVMVSEVSANSCTYAGLGVAGAGVSAAITRSIFSGSRYGVASLGSGPSSPRVYTYGDNRILGNDVTDVYANLTFVGGN
jgi:hypothetical protein